MELKGCFDAIEKLIASDAGGRGIAPLVQPGTLELAASALLKAERVALVSGFYIPGASACETDGPPGAWALAGALTKLGVPAIHVTDTWCLPVFAAAGLEPLYAYPQDDLGRAGFSHLVAIERVGRAADGRYYNMRGDDITAWTAPLDELFLAAPARGWVTIGIGDGGNEIGMGKVHELVKGSVRHGAKIGSIVGTDHLLVAGTSNWGAWGLVAGLSLLAGRNLLPTPAEAAAHLDRLLAAGAVDGVTARSERTVDGLPWPQVAAVLEKGAELFFSLG